MIEFLEDLLVENHPARAMIDCSCIGYEAVKASAGNSAALLELSMHGARRLVPSVVPLGVFDRGMKR